jgi:hypothetical protein
VCYCFSEGKKKGSSSWPLDHTLESTVPQLCNVIVRSKNVDLFSLQKSVISFHIPQNFCSIYEVNMFSKMHIENIVISILIDSNIVQDIQKFLYDLCMWAVHN